MSNPKTKTFYAAHDDSEHWVEEISELHPDDVYLSNMLDPTEEESTAAELADNGEDNSAYRGTIYKGAGKLVAKDQLIPIHSIIELIRESPENNDVWVPENFMDKALKQTEASEGMRVELFELISGWMDKHDLASFYSVDDSEKCSVTMIDGHLEEVTETEEGL